MKNQQNLSGLENFMKKVHLNLGRGIQAGCDKLFKVNVGFLSRGVTDETNTGLNLMWHQNTGSLR